MTGNIKEFEALGIVTRQYKNPQIEMETMRKANSGIKWRLYITIFSQKSWSKIWYEQQFLQLHHITMHQKT